MTDPAKIDVDESMTYVRLSGFTSGTRSIPDPRVSDNPREWRGHKQDTSDDDRRLPVDYVGRGGWGFLYVETDDGELIDALEGEGYEPLTPDEFASTFDKAPEYTYLRTPKERTAKRANREFRSLSVVEPSEVAETEELLSK